MNEWKQEDEFIMYCGGNYLCWKLHVSQMTV